MGGTHVLQERCDLLCKRFRGKPQTAIPLPGSSKLASISAVFDKACDLPFQILDVISVEKQSGLLVADQFRQGKCSRSNDWSARQHGLDDGQPKRFFRSNMDVKVDNPQQGAGVCARSHKQYPVAGVKLSDPGCDTISSRPFTYQHEIEIRITL